MAKTSIAIKIKQAKSENVFIKANPNWKVIQPWIEGLKLADNSAEWMLSGKFKVIGPLGNEKIVRVNVYRDGIRVF